MARLALLTALALVLSYVEALIPYSFAVPGIKLGLPNLAVMFALYKLGAREAAAVSGIRVLLASFMFGNAFSLAYSLSGAALSLAVMVLLMRTGKLSPVGVSVAGGVAHNLGQILCAMVLLGTARIVYYLPVLIVSGVGAGILIGLVSGLLSQRVKL